MPVLPRRRTALALALAALAALLPATAVQADPGDAPSQAEVDAARQKAQRAEGPVAAAQREVADAAARLQQLGSALAVVSEQYNAAQYQLQQSQAASVAADRELARAQAEESAAADELAGFAAAAYRSGGDIARVSAMLSADGPQTLIDQAATMSVIGDRRSAVLARVQAARAASAVLQERATQALVRQQEAAAEVARTRDAAQRAVDEQQSLADTLEAKRVRLVSQLRSLRGRSEALAEERADALARESAERAAAEAALDAGTVTGDVPRGILLGMPVQVPPGSERGTPAGAAKAIEFAKAQLGKPYLWGGTGPDRFDCSGLTMRAWQAGGVSLAHWSVAQYAAGRKVPLSQIRPGDLVFFSTDLSEYRAIVHVGLYIGGGNMIEAPYTGANVRIAPIQRASLFGAARP
jgi:cell wall-associated NlpC family hydrolase